MIEVLAAGEVWTNPIIVGLVVGIPTSGLGLLAYRRAEKLDRAAAQAAMIATQGDAVQRVIDGLDLIIENLLVEKKEARMDAIDLREQLKECRATCVELRRLVAGQSA